VIITHFPDPSKVVQYCMGFIVIGSFINTRNVSQKGFINASANCNGTLNVPMDTVLAVASAVIAFVAVIPGEYLVTSI